MPLGLLGGSRQTLLPPGFHLRMALFKCGKQLLRGGLPIFGGTLRSNLPTQSHQFSCLTKTTMMTSGSTYPLRRSLGTALPGSEHALPATTRSPTIPQAAAGTKISCNGGLKMHKSTARFFSACKYEHVSALLFAFFGKILHNSGGPNFSTILSCHVLAPYLYLVPSRSVAGRLLGRRLRRVLRRTVILAANEAHPGFFFVLFWGQGRGFRSGGRKMGVEKISLERQTEILIGRKIKKGARDVGKKSGPTTRSRT